MHPGEATFELDSLEVTPGADLFVPRRRTRGGLRRLPATAAPAVVGTCEG
jgi:hypothetical protein